MESREEKTKKEEEELIKRYGKNARKVLEILKEEKKAKEDKGEER